MSTQTPQSEPQWSHLDLNDLAWCVRRLPSKLREIMKEMGPKLIMAGGFIRASVAREEVNDIDLFTTDKSTAEVVAERLSVDKPPFLTDNALTVHVPHAPAIQIIHRWTFAKPEDVVPSFDFSIARAAIWYDGQWLSMCDPRYYIDLSARRLVYCRPDRNEDAGGSMLRVLKFYQKGYRIPLDSLGAVMGRMINGIDFMKVSASDREGSIGAIVTALLREVDPVVDPDHFCH